MIGDFDLIQFALDIFVWFSDIFNWLCSPISGIAAIDFPPGLLNDLVEALLDSLVSIIQSTIGDMSIIQFCFGAGFSTWLLFSVIMFFRRLL